MSSEVDAGFLEPDWPAPAGVRALTTTRRGGVSVPPWDSFNLGQHVGDDPDAVALNRGRVASRCQVAVTDIHWLDQVHGTRVAYLPAVEGATTADASVCRTPGCVSVVLTADCLPVLFCTLDGKAVAAAHAGWRGLAAGVLERTVDRLGPANQVMAWLGPAIGPAAFEVGPEVRAAFMARDAAAETAFAPAPGRPGHYLADLFRLARLRLEAAGVTRVYGGGLCTYSEPERFYSYRRDGETGRMASLVWLSGNG